MTLKEMIELCDAGHKSKAECEDVRERIYKEMEGLTAEEREVLADYLEELEMAIEWY